MDDSPDHYQPSKTIEECVFVQDAIPFEVQNVAVLSTENYSYSYEYVKTELVPTSLAFKPVCISFDVGWCNERLINTKFNKTFSYRYLYSREIIRPPVNPQLDTRLHFRCSVYS